MDELKVPMFSVIIIYYNSQKYVAKSVESVLGQTFDDFELILVDDGSNDSTLKICEQYEKQDSRIRVIHKENGGQSDARNVGIKNAKGEYVLLIDGDDYIDSRGLQCFRNLIEESSHKVDYVFGKMCYFYDETGEVYSKQRNLESDIVNGKNGRDAFKEMFYKDGHISMGVRGAFRREFLIQNNIFFPKRYYEDINVIMQVLLKANMIMVNTQDYYYFRDRKDSTSKKFSITHISDIFCEMNWWSEQIESGRYETTFIECVRLEIDRRIKIAIKKYAQLLPYNDVRELAELIRANKALFYPSQSFFWKSMECEKGLYLLRIAGKIKKRIKR